MSRRLAFGLITLLALAMFARPLFRGEVLTFRDHSDYFQPLRFFTADEVRHFRLPLWNPYNASGEPWLANPQTGLFYPPAWIFLFLPFPAAYVLYLCLHVALLGCGAFLLFSRFGSPRGAFIGSLMLMLCGPTMSMVDVSNNLTTFAWIPLVLWCAMADVSAAASGAAIAMSFLAGEPFFAAMGAVMFVLSRVTGSRLPVPGQPATGNWQPILDTAITAFCLAGIQLIPFLAIIAGSDRATGVAREEVLRDSMSLGDWLRVIVPSGTTHQQFIPTVYMGIVAVVLAIVGITARAARPWVALLIASVVVSLGGDLLAKLPLTIFRYPARVVPLGALAIVAMAVLGWERAQRFVPFFWFPMIVVALIIADLVPRIAPLLESTPFDAHPIRWARNIGRDGKIARMMPPEMVGFDRRAWIAGYLNLFDHRFDAWTAAPMVSQSYTHAYVDAFRHHDLLDRMSIAYILVNTPGGVVTHRNSTALPMAYFRDAAGHIGSATLLACTTSAVHVWIVAPSDGIVVVTQQDAPGWSVEVDGVEASGERDGVFRAVRVRRGNHKISWRYRPASLMIGSALTIIAIARMLLWRSFVKRK